MERSTRSTSEARLWAVALSALVALAPVRGLAADPAEMKAKALFKDGQQSYDLGQFAKALELYSEAYKLKPLPGFLFNIAQCHRQMGNWEQSAFFFGRFIDNSNPKAPNIEVARELLEDARRKQAQAAEEAKAAEDRRRAEEDKRAQEEQARRKADDEARRAADAALAQRALPPPPPPPAEEPVTKKAWFWVLVVGGAAAVAGGATAAVVVATRPAPGPAVLSETTLGQIEVK
jgi:tetratricopeptide (TPR) repeat protein